MGLFADILVPTIGALPVAKQIKGINWSLALALSNSSEHPCLLLAQSRHAQYADEYPLLGANRTFDQPLLTNLDL
jgi:hypothetical protein